MIEFMQADEAIKKELNITAQDVYVLKANNNVLGYGIFYEKQENLEFVILNKYRGNGYGKILFAKLLAELKARGCIETFMHFANDNYVGKKMVESQGGIPISMRGGTVKYVIPIK